MKTAKQKALMTQNPVYTKDIPSPPPSWLLQVSRPRRFLALAQNARCKMLKESDGDFFAGNKGDESDTNTSNNDGDSGDSDNAVYTWPS